MKEYIKLINHVLENGIEKKEYENVELIFLGEGPTKKSLEQYVKELNLSKYISFKGNVSNVSHFLKTSNIYLHTANYEPLDAAKFEYKWQWAYKEKFEK